MNCWGYISVLNHKLLVPLLIIILCLVGNTANAFYTRGFTVDHTLKEKDFFDLSQLGAKSVRVSFARLPFISSSSPFKLNLEAFSVLDNYLAFGEKYGISIILDPHRLPDAQSPYSSKPTDSFWQKPELRKAWIRMWIEIAKRYAKNKASLLVYDLINEPAPPFLMEGYSGRCHFYQQFVEEMVAEVRRFDSERYIVIQFPFALRFGVGSVTNQMDAVSCLSPISDSKIVYSFHMYDPGHFTHQGVLPGFNVGVSLYKGKSLKSVKKYLVERLSSVRSYQKKYNVPIYVGEIGVSRYAGEEGNLYVQQLLEIFSQYDWSWSYHSFREARVWDPELAPTSSDGSGSNAIEPTINVISRFLKK